MVRIRDAWWLACRSAAAAMLVMSAVSAGGCRGSGTTPDEPVTLSPQIERPGASAPRERIDVPDEVNESRRAAMMVATLPPDDDPAHQQQIALLVALYRAAIDDGVRDGCRYFLIDWDVNDMAALAVEPPSADRELALRVLAGLHDAPAPIAWLSGGASTDSERRPPPFPGTRTPAAVISARLTAHDADHASVNADISARLPDGRGWRQQVVAIWDGVAWSVRDDRLRVTW